MHENEKSEDSGNIVLAIIAALLIITPVAALVGYIYYKTELDGYLSRITNTLNDFWLMEYEKERYTIIINEIEKEEVLLNKGVSKAIQSGLIVKTDGTFRNIEKVSEDLQDEIILHGSNLKSLKSKLDYLSNSPITQWESFNATARTVISLKTTLIGWLVLFILYLITKQDFWDAYISASAISIFAFFIFYGIFSKEGEKHSPRPPIVNFDNLDFDKQTEDPEFVQAGDGLYLGQLKDGKPNDLNNINFPSG